MEPFSVRRLKERNAVNLRKTPGSINARENHLKAIDAQEISGKAIIQKFHPEKKLGKWSSKHDWLHSPDRRVLSAPLDLPVVRFFVYVTLWVFLGLLASAVWAGMTKRPEALWGGLLLGAMVSLIISGVFMLIMGAKVCEVSLYKAFDSPRLIPERPLELVGLLDPVDKELDFYVAVGAEDDIMMLFLAYDPATAKYWLLYEGEGVTIADSECCLRLI